MTSNATSKGDSTDSVIAKLSPIVAASGAERFEPFPLTDIQQAYWVGRLGSFQLGNISSHWYREIAVKEDFDCDRFERALNILMERQDMLRARVTPDGKQEILESVPWYKIKRHDLREAGNEEISTHVEKMRAKLSHQVLSVDSCPSFDFQ